MFNQRNSYDLTSLAESLANVVNKMISPKGKISLIYEELKKEINEGKYPVGQPFFD